MPKVLRLGKTNIWENPAVEADDDEDDTPAFL